MQGDDIMKLTYFFILRPVLALSAVSCLLSGCFASHATSGSLEQEPQFVVHQVRYSGESLWLLAAWYARDGRKWHEILAANPGLRPSAIKIGSEIQIPSQLVVRAAPLERSFIEKALGPKGRDATPQMLEDTSAAEPPEEDMRTILSDELLSLATDPSHDDDRTRLWDDLANGQNE